MALLNNPVKLLSTRMHLLPGKHVPNVFYTVQCEPTRDSIGKLLVAELLFRVPLDYSQPEAGSITLFGRAATNYEKPADAPKTGGFSDPTKQPFAKAFNKPWMVYLEGGPGGGNRAPQDHPVAKNLLNRGYQMLYLDYRGTGMSTPVNAASLVKLGGPAAQAEYLKHFRADNIVRDLEGARQALPHHDDEQPGRENKTWSLVGQSYGGFVALTYLSFHPSSVREVFLLGGLAPINKPADVVYRATYRKLEERNKAFFQKYPEDRDTLAQIASYFRKADDHAVEVAGGGKMTFGRIMTLGLGFGMHGGLDSVHNILVKVKTNLDQLGLISRATMHTLEQSFPLDVSPIYAILHEPIYCYAPGVKSAWAAERVAKEHSHDYYSWIWDEAAALARAETCTPWFSGEMIYPFMFDTFPELIPLKEAAHILAETGEWTQLYDEEQLARNEVPVYAASYIEDLYVDYELSKQNRLGCLRTFETNVMYHDALRSKTDEVVGELFKLRDDFID